MYPFIKLHDMMKLCLHKIILVMVSNGQSGATSVMAKCFVCLSPTAFSYHRWLVVM